jgi:hypothetical protein
VADVQVNIVAKSSLAATAKKDAESLKKLAAAEKARNKASFEDAKKNVKAQEAAAKLTEQAEKAKQRESLQAAKETQKNIAATLKAQVARQKLEIKEAKAAVKAKDIAEKKAAKEKEKAEKKAKAAAAKAAREKEQQGKKQLETVKKFKEGNIAEAIGLGAVGVAGAAVVLTLVAATAAATALTVAIGAAAVEANTLKNNTTSALNVLTAGRGAETLKLLDGLAEQLGMKFQDVRDKFVEFRQAGADNKLSANLLKLTADLNTIDSSGKLAAEAIEKVLSHKNTDGTLDIKTANKEMALLAKQAGVAGNGAIAAAARFTTLGGALNSLDNSKTKFLEEIGAKVQPAIDKAAGSIAKLVDEFLKSAKGKKFIEGISNAIIKLAEIVEASLPYIQATFEGVFEGLKFFGPMFTKIGETLAWAFGSDKKESLEGFKTAIQGITIALGIVVTAVGAALAAVAAIPAMFVAAQVAISELGQTMGKLAVEAYNWGKNIVLGVVKGVSDFAGQLLSKVSGLANSIKDKFASALKIASPSRVFEQFGKFTAQGFGQGFERDAPEGSQMAAGIVQAATSPAAPAAAASAGGGPAGVTVNVTIGSIPQGASPAEYSASLRRELQAMLIEMGLSRGVV